MCSSHSAGDVLMVQPGNLADVVEEFITFFALDPNRTFLLEQNDPGIFFANKVTTLIDVNVVVFVYSLNVIITVVIVVCDWVFFVIVIITPITISLLLSPPPSTSSSSSSSSSTWKVLARFTYQFYEKNIDLCCSSQSTIIVLWYPVLLHSCIVWKAPGFICTRVVSLRFDPQKWWLLENSDLYGLLR